MNTVEGLKQRAQQWAAMVVELHNTPVPLELEEEKKGLLQFAKRVKESIERVFPDAFATAEELNKMDLGAIPLIIPAVLVAAAATAITKWIYDYKKFMTKVMMHKNLVEGGASNEQAARVITQLENKSNLLGTISGKVLLPIGGLLIAYQFLK
jgi:citrate lyase gamma subunit